MPWACSHNLGIWADKFMFWYFPPTSDAIIGGLRASLIYDLPVFLSYLSIIPGMAVFLVRIETDFVEFYDKFYDAVRSGGSLEYIRSCATKWSMPIQQGLGEIAKSDPGRAGHLRGRARRCWTRWASRACTCRCCMCRWLGAACRWG